MNAAKAGYFVLCISLFVFSGCAVFTGYESGKYITQAQMDSLVDKKSTSKDVITMIGQPSHKTMVNNREIWYYYYSKINHITANVEETSVFEFDAKGVLQEHYKTADSGGGSSGNPLMR